MKLRKTTTAVAAPVVETETADKPQVLEVMSIDPTTLAALIEKSHAIAADSEDFTVVKANPRNVRFNDHAGLTYITEDGRVHESPISRYALGQLGTKIGVPARYLEKCVQTGRLDLAQENVNSWLESYNKDLFIREYQGSVRGVLSNKYSVCDSHEVLEVVDSEVDLSKYKIKGSYLSAERLHVRLVSRDMLPIDGEDLFAGLFIDSSDVGRSLLTVQFGIYKQVCTNGLTIVKAGGILFHQKHIGITSAEFQTRLAASLSRVDELADHAVEWVADAQKKSAWGDKKKVLSQQDMDDFLARVRGQTQLPEDGAKKVLDLMQSKYGDSRWGLINSITEVAQDYTLERRLDLERVAGNLLVA